MGCGRPPRREAGVYSGSSLSPPWVTKERAVSVAREQGGVPTQAVCAPVPSDSRALDLEGAGQRKAAGLLVVTAAAADVQRGEICHKGAF